MDGAEGRMKLISYLGLVAGLVLFGGLLFWQGIGAVFHLLIESGWPLLLLPVVWFPNLFPETEAWRLVFPGEHKPAFKTAFAAIWMGRAVNVLLPVATIGGEVVKARLMILWGARGTDASASVLVDKTVQVLAVAAWALTGIGILAYLAIDNNLVRYALLGLCLLMIGVTGFLLAQRAGMFGMLSSLGARLIPHDSWEGIAANAREVDRLVVGIYRQRVRILQATLLKTLGLIIQTTEVWLACYLLGAPISLLEAMMLKSLTATLADIAFVVPNAYGIQEGSYMMVGALLGLGPDLSLAVSLAVRIREVIIDVPGLLAWQFIESHNLIRRRAGKETAPLADADGAE